MDSKLSHYLFVLWLRLYQFFRRNASMKFSQCPKLSLVSSFLAISFTVFSCSSAKNTESSKSTAPNSVQTEDSQNIVEGSSALKNATIYFDFNKYVIRADQVPTANSIAAALKLNPNLKIQIQGNTDDRGSVEYNLALGTKRADALKEYLVAHGVASENISVVSYGKEHPAVQGSGESVWSKNRRDDVVEQK